MGRGCVLRPILLTAIVAIAALPACEMCEIGILDIVILRLDAMPPGLTAGDPRCFEATVRYAAGSPGEIVENPMVRFDACTGVALESLTGRPVEMRCRGNRCEYVFPVQEWPPVDALTVELRAGERVDTRTVLASLLAKDIPAECTSAERFVYRATVTVPEAFR